MKHKTFIAAGAALILIASSGVAVAVTSGIPWQRPPASPGFPVLTAPQPPPPAQPGEAGEVATFAGSGEPNVRGVGHLDGDRLSALFGSPQAIAFDSKGRAYIADAINNVIRRIDADGRVTTAAGTGVSGYKDGSADIAQFDTPSSIAVGKDDSVYVSDSGNNRIRRITAEGVVSTFAGSGGSGLGEGGFADGQRTTARFNNPVGLAFDQSGTLFVADKDNHRIRAISMDGNVRTFAGNGRRGVVDGAADVAQFNFPVGIAIAADGTVLVSDQATGDIRRISANRTVSTLVPAGVLLFPAGLALSPDGTLLVADYGHNQIQRVSTTGQVRGVAGSGVQSYVDGRNASAAFSNPTGVTVGPDGRIYVADSGNNRIRTIAVAP